ncbi:MAG: hypothetical protein LBT36_05695, partial [Oscillospiraceae bacterium]|nr:hypothetical protein [Oscillospiraceae bacterium]
MKFCAFTAEDGTHIGAWTASGVVDLTALGFASDMDTIIAGGEPLRAWIQSALDAYTGARLREDALVFANVTRPGKIVCAGLNYTDHAAETGGEPPQYPVLFSKFNDTLAPAGAPVSLPPWL